LTFSVHLDRPGERRYIRFKVVNFCNRDAVLGTLSTTPPAANSGIIVTWPSLNGATALTGAITPEYTIEVQWDPAYPEANQDVTLSASINYAQFSTAEVSNETKET
jgi:hypothetical protein